MGEARSSRDLVRRSLEGRPVERSPIVLHFGPYAARLQQTSYRQMCDDATLLANSLRSAQQLFGCDGLILLADPTLEAEACGCEIEWQNDEPTVASHPLAEPGDPPTGGGGPSGTLDLHGVERRGRLSAVFEAARRLAAVIGKESALLPAVTGPVTLASHLRGRAFWADLEQAPEQAYRVLETSGQVTLSMARQYLDMGFEQVVVSDPLLGQIDPEHYPAIASVLRSLWNVADFYDALILLQTAIDDQTRLERLAGIGAHGLLVESDNPLDPAALGGDRQASLGVPARLLDTESSGIEQAIVCWLAEAGPAEGLAHCFTIPRSVPPENVHTLMRLLRG